MLMQSQHIVAATPGNDFGLAFVRMSISTASSRSTMSSDVHRFECIVNVSREVPIFLSRLYTNQKKSHLMVLIRRAGLLRLQALGVESGSVQS